MGNQQTPISQRIAKRTCCSTRSVPEQKELDMESHTYRHEKKPKPSNRKQYKKPNNYQQSQPIPEYPTPKEYESNIISSDTNFDFNQWIIDNKLESIKDIFIHYKMTNIASLSNESNLYRNFIQDQRLMMNHPQLMPIAIKAIEELNKSQYKQQEIEEEEKEKEEIDDDDDGYNDPNLIKQHSLQLCNDAKFGGFVAKHLKKKLMNNIWDNLDSQNKGYIESVDDIANGIGFIATLYKKHLYKKMHRENVEESKDEPQNIQKQANQIALWICKSYGSIDKKDDSNGIQYKYRITKNEFQHNLPKWIQQYADSEGTI